MDADSAKQIAQTVYKRFGRPYGSRNYGARSYLAREMKHRGIRWTDEVIESYLLYKRQTEACLAGTVPPPDGTLLEFWAAMMPYIAVKLIDQETRGKRPRVVHKPKISDRAIAQLAKLEGRKI